MRINSTVRTMWDELAATAAAVQDEEAAVTALGVVVLALESAAVTPEDARRMAVQAEVGELVERQPEEVAQLLRGWLADRRN